MKPIVNQFKIGDVVELSDHDLNIDLIKEASSFARFIMSKRYFKIKYVNNETVSLDGSPDIYDCRRFRIAKNHIVTSILNDL